MVGLKAVVLLALSGSLSPREATGLVRAPRKRRDDDSAICGGFLNCHDCVTGGDCGWCPSSNSCLPSSDDASCTEDSEHGAFNTHDSLCICANPTANFLDCDSCNNNGCSHGWCPSTGKCYHSTDGTQPFGGTPACPTNSYNGSFSGHNSDCVCMNPTTTKTTCDACNNNGCSHGWCPSTAACYHSADGKQPFGGSPACPTNAFNGSFSSHNSDCVCMNPTTTKTSCDSCNNNGCNHGWCPALGKCYENDPSGDGPFGGEVTCPKTAANDTWNSHNGLCACGNPLELRKSCDQCCNFGCSHGWCPGTSECFAGDDSGPYGMPTCPGWNTHNSQCR